MASEKLIRCIVKRGGSPPSVRYIPHDIFGLWQYLMAEKHGFVIENGVSSLWMDEEEAKNIITSGEEVDDVDELVLLLFDETEGMFKRICRYYPSGEVQNLREKLVSHFVKGDTENVNVSVKKGVWVKRLSEKESIEEATPA